MHKVVFVEDELDLCELYHEMFSSSCVEVLTFSNLNLAESYINENQVALTFIDYRMPKMNGAEFRKKIKDSIPCFLLTGEFLSKDKVHGFIDVLEKPLTLEIFDSLLKSYGLVYDNQAQNNYDPYETLFKNLDQEVHIWRVVKDNKGKIKTWKLHNANQVALGVWNKKIEDILGKTTEEIFPEADAIATFLPIVEEAFSSNKPVKWTHAFCGTNQELQMTTIACGEFFISYGGDQKLE